ncbi:hypothetical protein MLD38_040803 [Melastoma candidum]|nr:hypothetical protein MLD38_040803 [Melastoma candidum]
MSVTVMRIQSTNWNRAGKSSLLNSFLERPFSDTYTTTTEDRDAVNVVEQTVVDQIAFTILVDSTSLVNLISSLSLRAGGKIILVFREIPANRVRNPFPMAIQDSTRVSQDMGIEPPIPIRTKLGDFNNVFLKD